MDMEATALSFDSSNNDKGNFSVNPLSWLMTVCPDIHQVYWTLDVMVTMANTLQSIRLYLQFVTMGRLLYQVMLWFYFSTKTSRHPALDNCCHTYSNFCFYRYFHVNHSFVLYFPFWSLSLFVLLHSSPCHINNHHWMLPNNKTCTNDLYERTTTISYG